MAEGSGEFGHEDPDLDNRLDHDSDEGEQEVDTTRPFQPGTASTPYQPGDPYHGGKQTEMSTFPHEQSGLPDTSYQEEIPLLSDFIHPDDEKVMIEKGWENIKKVYPNANRAKLGPIKLGKEKGNLTSLVVKPANKEYRIFQKDGVTLQKSFIKLKESALGRKANVIILEHRDTIREIKQRLVEAENQLQQAETLSSQREEEKREVEDLRRKIEQTDAKIDGFQDEHCSNIESEADLRRLKQLKKNYQTDLENKKKKLDSLTKKARNMEKEQEKVDRLRASIAAKESETNAMEERLNQTKPLDDLKEQESELQRQNEEDQAIIQDESASPSEKEAAEGRVAERDEEIVHLQTQIAERERGRPLLERVKEIFKKYGVTLTAILLAAGITIGAVIGVLTRGLKATGKALGNGLKDIAAKLGSLLPGLIGSIVSFLFKAAGQVVGFLAEHTWLLILAAVGFLFEEYFKKQR